MFTQNEARLFLQVNQLNLPHNLQGKNDSYFIDEKSDMISGPTQRLGCRERLQGQGSNPGNLAAELLC